MQKDRSPSLFDKKDDPCAPFSSGAGVNTYEGTLVPGTTNKYEVKCTVGTTNVGHPFPYQPISPPPAPGPHTHSVTPCKGCYLEIESSN